MNIIDSIFRFSRKAAGFMPLEAHGVKCLCKTSDKEENLVLLHGFSDRPEGFFTCLSGLEKKFNIYLPYLPGHSDKFAPPNIQYNKEFYCKTILNFINDLKLNNVAIIAHSFGCIIPPFLASNNVKIQKLVLIDPLGIEVPNLDSIIKRFINTNINPFAISTTEDFDHLMKLSFYKIPMGLHLLKKSLIKDLKDRSQVLQKISNDSLFFSKEDLKDTIKMSDFSKIKCETKIIWGKHDAYFPLTLSDYYLQEISNSSLEVIKNCGHLPHYEKPLILKNILKNFLDVVS